MTKKNKFKESPKVKILVKPSKAEFSIMYSAITAPKGNQPVSIQDWKNKESLYDSITEGSEKIDNGLTFNDKDELILTISDHEILMKDLQASIWTGLEGARKADELLERLKNCETVDRVEEVLKEVETK